MYLYFFHIAACGSLFGRNLCKSYIHHKPSRDNESFSQVAQIKTRPDRTFWIVC